MRIIGFNGPPRSGKDTLAKAIHFIDSDEYRFIEDTAYYNAAVGAPFDWGSPETIESRALILPIRKVVFHILGLPYDADTYDSIKDEPQPLFNGETIRHFMIRLMEEHIKPNYGQNFAVRAAMVDVLNSVTRYENQRLMLVTDIGFQEEVDYLETLVAPENFLLVHVIRPKTSFAGDSRSYVRAEQTFVCPNTGTPEQGAKRILQHAYNKFGWEF